MHTPKKEKSRLLKAAAEGVGFNSNLDAAFPRLLRRSWREPQIGARSVLSQANESCSNCGLSTGYKCVGRATNIVCCRQTKGSDLLYSYIFYLFIFLLTQFIGVALVHKIT